MKQLQQKMAEVTSRQGGKMDFLWNKHRKTWCLAGITREGLVWETDDFESATCRQAKRDALAYLEAQNEQEVG